MKTAKNFTWNQINTALSMKCYSPAQILRVLSACNQVRRPKVKIWDWEEINIALSSKYNPAQILRILSALNRVQRENLVLVQG